MATITVRDLWRHDAQYETPLPGPIVLISQQEMERRIEAIRAVEAPTTCPTCGSTTAETVRTCWSCGDAKPLTAFVRNVSQPGGIDYLCRSCKATRSKLAREKRKRQAFRSILGRTG